MKIKAYTVGLLQTNCYLVTEAEHCILIDPGTNLQKKMNEICDDIAQKDLSVDGILLTHAHFDHILGVDFLCQRFQCPLYLHKDDMELTFNPELNLSKKLTHHPFQITSPITELQDKQTFSIQNVFQIEILHTPGHTPGSSCYFLGNTVFTGDTLFNGSAGRTDLPGGNQSVLFESLAKIQKKCGNSSFTGYPGHGPSMLFPQEFETNPYYKSIL